MLHLSGETWVVAWVVVMALAARWHHVLATGSQPDSYEAAPGVIIENMGATFSLDPVPPVSSESGLTAIEQV